MRKKELSGQGKSDSFLGDEQTPIFVSALTFAACAPQSLLAYQMVWNDACSDAFLMSAEMAIGWIAIINALEGAAGVALGYIDYKIKGNEGGERLLIDFRKKRLAFAKFSFIMSIGTLFLLDGPSGNAVLPLIIGCGWNTVKMDT